MDDAVANFQAITGLSESEATNFLEMAGGNIDAAVSLFFDMGGASGGAPMDTGVSGSFGATDMPASGIWQAPFDWYTAVWPEAKPIHDAWLTQGLTFAEQADSRVGLLQGLNGPCGVLAALNAIMIAQQMGNDGFGAGTSFTDNHIALAIAACIAQCRPDPSQPVQMAKWEDQIGMAVKFESLSSDQVEKYVLENMGELRAPGGLILIIYSALHTRGLDQVRKDVSVDGGDMPLVFGINWLCTSELVSLLLRGNAGGGVGAYNATGRRTEWTGGFGVGLLSMLEKETGIPVCDALKSPAKPVWVVHGGDHFTILFGLQPCPTEAGSTFELFHWNGLPPAGPRMARIKITAPKGPAAPAPAAHKETYYKPEPGEIDDLVQAHGDDKAQHPKDWKKWRYEAVLAVDDPTVQGAVRDADAPLQPKFEQGEPGPGPWRCASCYATRFKTMCFGQNDDGAILCQHCGKLRAQAGWSLWMHYNDLPPKMQNLATTRHAPKIINLLRTKWPQCEASFDTEDAPSI